MAIGIIAGQTFTDKRGVDHTSAYGHITDIRRKPPQKFATFRIDVFIDEATANEGIFEKAIETFTITFHDAKYDSFFDEATILLVSNSELTKAQEGMLIEEVAGSKVIDDTIWEAI